ncbi:hypothetical protein [Actinacidiphila oryziradicis]|uniref:Uncharacterized protein n=1 Tax=Actinacidiphila oryziradicis TaxID=2571141 RepID=A0A4U0SAS0_9ACTN|nr:hypothetical protein [Actinacidiphila oryziradicis]TJZ97414.1 hypothetical protein FCI23_49725 [Actinacidiphila oryziradicis]
MGGGDLAWSTVGLPCHRERGRRRAPPPEQEADTGKWHLTRDRWHTGFVDALGTGGLLGQIEGRTARGRAGSRASKEDLRTLPGLARTGADGFNRVIELDARAAFGFRSGDNQSRRAVLGCRAAGARRGSRGADLLAAAMVRAVS